MTKQTGYVLRFSRDDDNDNDDTSSSYRIGSFLCPMHCALRRLLTQRYSPLLTREGICLSRADK